MNEEKIREERIFEIVHCPFEGRAKLLMPAEWAGQPVLVRWQLKSPMYDFKNSFSPAFVYIHRDMNHSEPNHVLKYALNFLGSHFNILQNM